MRNKFRESLLVLQGRSIFKNPWQFEKFLTENNDYFIIKWIVDTNNSVLFKDFIGKTTENWNPNYFLQIFFSNFHGFLKMFLHYKTRRPWWKAFVKLSFFENTCRLVYSFPVGVQPNLLDFDWSPNLELGNLYFNFTKNKT